MQKWKKNAYRILGPLPTQFSSCDFIPEVRGGPDWQWSLGCPKWFRRRAWKGDVLKIQFPRGEEKFLSSREWVKWVFAFDGLTTLYLCKIFGSIPGWSCLWYLTILLYMYIINRRYLYYTCVTPYTKYIVGMWTFRVVCEYLGWFVNLQDLDTRPSPNPIGCFSPQEEEVIYLEGRLLIGAMDFPWVGKCGKRLILHPDWRGWKNACVW